MREREVGQGGNRLDHQGAAPYDDLERYKAGRERGAMLEDPPSPPGNHSALRLC